MFKIQANMDPKHRDRIAFVRLVLGPLHARHEAAPCRAPARRIGVHNAMLFLANERELAEEAWAGDIIGIPNHGTLRIGDALTEGEALHFTGIPSFAPEFLRRVRADDPMKRQAPRPRARAARRGGRARRCSSCSSARDFIVGVVGALQFDVLADRIRSEYDLPVPLRGARRSRSRAGSTPTIRSSSRSSPTPTATTSPRITRGATVFLARNDWQLNRAKQDYPQLRFLQTREQAPLTAASA